jgi:glutathione S-transferase
MSNYKLVYFNSRGRAETSRLVFAQAGVEYEDKRVTKDELAQMKPSSPSGMLPMLEVDGKLIIGSMVITRFLAERFGLAGSNDVENAEIAGIIDILNDFMLCLVKLFYEKDEEKKAQLKKKFDEEDIPRFWGIFDKRCKDNNAADGWIYGNKPTYADFSIFNMLEFVLPMAPTLTEKFPCVGKLKTAVETLPKIAEWLKNRPVTEH